MYKFNFLNDINENRLREAKQAKFVSSVSYVFIAASIILIGLLYFFTVPMTEKYEEDKANLAVLEKEYKIVRKKSIFKNSEVRKVYNYYSKRVQWSKIISIISENLEPNFIINEIYYNKNRLIVRYLIKTNNIKSDIAAKINSYKDSLENIADIKYFLENGIENTAINKEKDNEDGNSIWSFNLNMKLKSIYLTKSERKNMK